MKTAILAVTLNGIKVARLIRDGLENDCQIFTLEKYCKDDANYEPLTNGVKESMKNIFCSYKNIIMVMSCGIAVRTIGPYLESKLTDPAIVVLDELGKNVISLISGHVGGANELAIKVAGITRGNPIITTASDNQKVISIDMLAKKFDLVLTDYEKAKGITSDIVNGRNVGLISDVIIKSEIGYGVTLTTWEKIGENDFASLIYIGNKDIEEKELPLVKLVTKNIVIGIGCRKGIKDGDIIDFVKKIFNEHKLSIEAIHSVCTIGLKSEEKGILNLCRYLRIPLKIIDDKLIKEIENNFECSNFVRKTVGFGCVCEPCGFLGSKLGKQLIPKRCFEGITLSVYEEAVTLEVSNEG